MRWQNLKFNKCPACRKNLKEALDGDGFICSCNFAIGQKRYLEIIKDITGREVDRMQPDRSNWE
jgi:tRNA(Ile2) C34 agmatinyltransferase TiaS